MNVLIIHGSYGHPGENWFPWLKDELKALGHTVFIPKFPSPENQSLESWTKMIEVLDIPFGEDLIIIAHSLGPAFALSLLETRKAKACFFASGFLCLLGDPDYDRLNESFVTREFDWEAIKQNCPIFILYHGDNDPYIPVKTAEEFAKNLGVKIKFIRRGGHLNAAAGYGTFPELLEDFNKLLGVKPQKKLL